MIRHIVLFSASPGQRETIVRDLRALEQIPSAQLCQVRENLGLDQQSREIDVVVYAEFIDQNALDEFKAHDIYHQTVRKVRPQRQLRLVADCEV